MTIVSALRCNHPIGNVASTHGRRKYTIRMWRYSAIRARRISRCFNVHDLQQIQLSTICFQKWWFVCLSREKVYYCCHCMPISTIILWLCRACQFYLWRKQEYQESPTNVIQMLCRVHLAKYDDRNYCLINDSMGRCQYHTIPSEQRRHHYL